jgi:hypothetical protein
MSGRIAVGVDVDVSREPRARLNLWAPDRGPLLAQLTTVEALQLVTDILTAIRDNGLLNEALP